MIFSCASICRKSFSFIVTLNFLQKVSLCFEFAQNNSFFFLNQFYQRETLLSFNKLCKNAYGCLLIIRGTSLAICMMTLETSIPLIWVLCVPWSKASMFCPRCDVRSEIFLLLLDRVTYWDQSYNEILTEQKYAYMMKLPL